MECGTVTIREIAMGVDNQNLPSEAASAFRSYSRTWTWEDLSDDPDLVDCACGRRPVIRKSSRRHHIIECVSCDIVSYSDNPSAGQMGHDDLPRVKELWNQRQSAASEAKSASMCGGSPPCNVSISCSWEDAHGDG